MRKSYLEKVRPFVGLDVVKVITGMRRSGRSVLMEQIRDEIILKDDPHATVFYLNLEEEENAKFLKKGVLHEQILKVFRKAKEIDFVAEKGGDKRYYQVAYLMPDEKVRAREFGAFEGLKDGFSRFVVSMDPVDMSNNGIRHMNICDFLVQSE